VLVESLIVGVAVLAGLGLGIAVDYSLLLITRWRKEREAGRSNEETILAASPTAGRAAPPPARAWLNHRL